MIKIPCLFERDFSNVRRPTLLKTVTSGCEWALTSSGIPTRKRDGTACLVRDGKLYKRYDVKTSRGARVPEGAIACIPAADLVTGHWPHWIEATGPESKWHVEAFTGLRASDGSRFRDAAKLEDGTYELCGPRINGNPEGLPEHVFIKHGSEVLTHPRLSDEPRTWEGLHNFLLEATFEGIVFHHVEKRDVMCKIRRDDFGFPWPLSSVSSEKSSK